MNSRLRLIVLSPALRWSVAVVVLIAALAVALWPRHGVHDNGAGDTVGNGSSGPSSTDLVAAQAQAALRPCRKAPGTPARTEHGALAGVRATCLADGRPIDVGAAVAGRPTLVNLWASWCVPCRDELPLLAKYADEHASIDVLEVEVRDQPVDGLEFLTSIGVHLPSVYDADGSVAAALRAPSTLPASYVLDGNGGGHFVADPRVFTSVDAIAAAVHRYGGP
ncbi:MAG: TlpA family protein disulfide reductase [Sciscionella sp.]|nr:TlpA family protein disulfide reductase [Sciscionella sp.]